VKSGPKYIPGECRCSNCCNPGPKWEAETRWARNNRKKRILGIEKRYREPTAYQQRAFRKEHPPLFGGKRKLRSAPKKIKRFYRWQTSLWRYRQAFAESRRNRLAEQG